MKTEYIALTPMGLCAAILVGVLVGTTVHASDASHTFAVVGIAILLCLHVRSDAIRPIDNGTYRRRWIVWQRQTDAPDNGRQAFQNPADKGEVTLQ